MDIQKSLTGDGGYSRDWPEWAKDAAFDADRMVSRYRRATADGTDQYISAMLAESIVDGLAALRAIALTGGPDHPKTRYEAADRYLARQGQPSLATIGTWAQRELAAARQARTQEMIDDHGTPR